MSNKCVKCDGEYKRCDGIVYDTFPPENPYKCNKCGDKVWMSDELKTDSFKFEVAEIPGFKAGETKLVSFDEALKGVDISKIKIYNIGLRVFTSKSNQPKEQ